jgi:uncharacterized protein
VRESTAWGRTGQPDLVLRTATALRTLERSDRAAVLALCDQDPVTNVLVTERVEVAGSEPVRLGGEIWGMFEQGRLTSACWAGANLVPIGVPTPGALDALAQRIQRVRGGYSSLFGDVDAVLGLWTRLRGMGWRAREVRACQPLFALDRAPEVTPDPLVCPATPDDLLKVLPASVAMFIEEVGYSPAIGDGGATYRRRVVELLRQGRTFVRRAPGGEVVFKADLGSVSSTVAQVHGVWVDPRWRGQGICAPAMAAVVTAALAQVPVVSLYVNDYNVRALAAYRRVGFEQVGTFATVLF